MPKKSVEEIIEDAICIAHRELFRTLEKDARTRNLRRDVNVAPEFKALRLKIEANAEELSK